MSLLRAPLRVTPLGNARGRGLSAAVAGLVLVAGVALVVYELGFAGRGSSRPASIAARESTTPVEADTAGLEPDDPIADDARLALAAARRVEPRSKTAGTEAADDPDRLEATRGSGRPARPGSERYFLERCRALAAADAVAFDASARERLAAADTPLAEKVAWLLAARELGAGREDSLFDLALEKGRGEPRLRAAAIVLLERDARRSGPACLRLLRAVALDPKSDADASQRSRAASDAFAFADEPALAAAIDLVSATNDAALRLDVLRGLARNGLPAAAAHRERLVATHGWHAEAAQLASAAAPAADDSGR